MTLQSQNQGASRDESLLSAPGPARFPPEPLDQARGATAVQDSRCWRLTEIYDAKVEPPLRAAARRPLSPVIIRLAAGLAYSVEVAG